MPNSEDGMLPFAAWLQDHRQGRVHAEMTEQFHALVDAVKQHHKKGEIHLKILVEPADAGGAQVVVSDEVIVKAPQPKRPMALYFLDGTNNLLRDDPTRIPFEGMREIPPVPDAREVGA